MSQIERYDQARTAYRRGHVVGLLVFFIAWMVRSAMKVFEIESDPLYTFLLVVLLIACAFQAFFAWKDNALKKEINRDPFLKNALHDELYQLNELKAWRTAFFSLIGFITFAAILSLFVTYNDVMLVFITALLVGFGSYNTAVFLLNR